MYTNVAAFPLVFLLMATTTIHPTEVKVLNTNTKGGIVKVEMWLAHDGKWEMEFHVKNTTRTPISFNANIDDIVKSQFMGFPQIGALQLRSVDEKTLKIKYEMPDGWWYPNILNSTLRISKSLNDDMEPCVLPGGGEKIIKFDCQKAFNMIQPAIKAESCRVGIKIKAAVEDGGINSYFITSDWFHIPQAK